MITAQITWPEVGTRIVVKERNKDITRTQFENGAIWNSFKGPSPGWLSPVAKFRKPLVAEWVVRGGVKLPALGKSYFFTESWQTIPTLKLRALKLRRPAALVKHFIVSRQYYFALHVLKFVYRRSVRLHLMDYRYWLVQRTVSGHLGKLQFEAIYACWLFCLHISLLLYDGRPIYCECSSQISILFPTSQKSTLFPTLQTLH